MGEKIENLAKKKREWGGGWEGNLKCEPCIRGTFRFFIIIDAPINFLDSSEFVLIKIPPTSKLYVIVLFDIFSKMSSVNYFIK